MIGGGDSAYEEAFRLKPEEFDEQFDKYLKDRFKPFRDKERPADYGKDLAPKREKTPYVAVVSIEPSPSGDLMAVAAGNRKDQELDIVLLSTKDGKVIRNLTSGFNQNHGYEYIATPGGFRNNAVPWMSWAPAGDRIAYFARTEKQKTLILQNVVTTKIEQRIELKTVDMPESPDISPDGKEVAFSALQGATGDIFIANLEIGSDPQPDERRSSATTRPTYAPDGKSLIYLSRVSGNDKLFRWDFATNKKTQITFGTHDDGGAQFMDDDTIVFPSTATDPNQPLDAEVARNGNIYNVWTLNLKTGELRQFTDTLTGNVSPVVLRDQKPREDRLRHLLQGRIRHPHADSRRAAAHRGHARTSARPGRSSTSRRRSATRWSSRTSAEGNVREAVPRGPAAAGPRRHERWRLVRRHAGDVHRRPGRQAVQHLRRVGVAVPDVRRARTSTCRTASSTPSRAYSQKQFFYGYDPATLYGLEYGFIDRDTAHGHADARRAGRLGDLPAEPVCTVRDDRPACCSSSRNTTSRACSRSPINIRSISTGGRCSSTARSCRLA